jgi:hypothetical protein
MRFLSLNCPKKRMNIALLRFITLSLIVVALGACSTIRLAYNNADVFLYQFLDGFLDFDPQQEQFSKTRITALLAWHRKEELPAYAQWLEKIRAQIDAPLSAAQVRALTEDLNAKSDRLITRALPDLAELATQLTPDNLTYLQERYAKALEETRKDYVQAPRNKQLERRFDQVLSSVERIYGRFSREQREKLRAASDARPLDHRNWLAERTRRQQEILAVLTQISTEKLTVAEGTAKLRAVAQRFSPSPDAQRREYFEQVNQSTYEVIALATELATGEQRQKARQTLTGWITDLNTLAARQ